MNGLGVFRRRREVAPTSADVVAGIDVVPLGVLLPVQAPVELPAQAAPVSDGLRCRVEVVTTSGRAALIVFEVRVKTVQVWHHRRLSGIFDRATLKSWLAEPHLPIVAADVTLSLDRMVDHDGRLALTLPDVTAWVLSPAEFQHLKARV